VISTEKYTEQQLPNPPVDHTLASIVHELSNPLTTILGLSEMLLEGSASPDHKLTRIRAEAQRSVRIIRNILDLSRAESMASFDGRTPVDLNEAIRHSAALVEDQLESHGIGLTVELPWRAPMVHSRPGELTQVFLNLITNAVQAITSAGRPGTITITGNQLGNRVCVTVEDDGPGFTDEDFHHLFKPFFTTKRQGTGMGLNLSRKIIQNIDGELWASRNPDRGAVFTIELPVLDAPAEHLLVV
jgi:signal transduction histidine kinase